MSRCDEVPAGLDAIRLIRKIRPIRVPFVLDADPVR